MGLIYKYTNTVNGKVYIGQTKGRLGIRDRKHITDKASKNVYFHRALKKYGRDKFILEVLEDNLDDSILDDREIYWVTVYDSYYTSGLGYNMTKGGKWSNSSQKLSMKQHLAVKEFLLNSNDSFQKIADRFKVSVWAISDINRGVSFYDSSLSYPLRPHLIDKSNLSEDIVNKIIYLLKTTTKTEEEIANEFTSILPYIVGQINRGKNSHCPPELTYPIRKWEQENTYNNVVTKENVISIIKELIFSDKSQTEIGRMFNIAKNTIGDISRGISWKEITSQFKLPIKRNCEENKVIYNSIYGIV